MTLNASSKCDCSAESKKWNPMVEVDELIKALEDETDVRKIAEMTHKCLHLMSLNDACEFMTKNQYPITPANILIFKVIAEKAYFARLDIMKELILK